MDPTRRRLLCRYVSRLRHDCLTAPKAHVFLLEEDSGQQRALKRACVRLPMPCPIREPIVGPWSVSERRARKWAALTACQQLFHAGELGSDLLPHPKTRGDEEEEEEEEGAAGLPKAGSRKRRREYGPQLAPELGAWQIREAQRMSRSGHPSEDWAGHPLAVYVLEVEPDTVVGCRLEDCFGADSLRLCLFFLVPLTCPESAPGYCLAQFPLFYPNGVSSASLSSVPRMRLSQSELRTVCAFHQLAMSCLLGPNSTFPLDQTSASPLDDLRFDMACSLTPFLCSIIRLGEHTGLAFDCMDAALTYAHCRTFAEVPRTLWKGAILRARHYKGPQQHQRERWTVMQVADHLSPSSVFPDSNSISYADYFGHDIKDLSQPLLQVIRIPTVPETALFRHPEALPRVQRRLKTVTHLVPELCDRYPLSLRLWLLVAPLPAALCRLNQLLDARRLHAHIWPHLTPSCGPCILRSDVSRPADRLKEGLDLTHFVEALTAIECRDFFNLERLEVMGDSFLKYAVSVVLYALNEGPHIQEGHLTSRRGRFICNATLFKRARARGLDRSLRSRFFDLPAEFLPPAFAPVAAAPAAWTRLIPDKAVSDCVEAIIGYALVHRDERAALQVMHWLDLDPGFCQHPELGITLPAAPAPWLAKISDDLRQICVQRLVEGLDKAEEIMGYRFRRPEFLIQAFTHASCVDNSLTECYQK